MADSTMVVGTMTPWLILAGVVVAVLILAVVGCLLVSVRFFSLARFLSVFLFSKTNLFH
jgi:hypothetical protein